MDLRNVSIPVSTAVKVLTYTTALLAFWAVARPVGPAWAVGFFLLCSASLIFERQGRFRIPRWLLNVVAAAIVGITLFRFSLTDPVTPALQALLLLLGIKLLEEKAFRDYMQIYLLSIFLLAGSSLISLGMDFLAALVLLMYLLATAIVLLTYYAEDRAMTLSAAVLRRIILSSLLIPTIAIPLSVIFFIMLPRTSLPLMSFLQRSGATTGFSEEIALGAVSAIQEDTSFIFRVVMPQVDDADLYWRGIVLDTFDGRRWSRSPQRERELSTRGGKVVLQTIYLEPYQNRYLFGLDLPVSTSLRNATLAHDRIVTIPQPVVSRLRYDIVSVLRAGQPDAGHPPVRYTELPDGDWGAVKRLVREITDAQKGFAAASAILAYLRDSGTFAYTMQGIPLSDDPVRSFLFAHRAGNCEYFASALAVMLRLEGIPARIVGGYRGGYYNEMAGYYAVAQKSAHVWVEAYFEGRGWVRLDPTPGSGAAFSAAQKQDFLLRVRILMDTLNHYWNAMVITYDFEKQIRLFTAMQQQARSLDPGQFISRRSLMVAALLAGALGAVYYAVRVVRRRGRPEDRLLKAFLAQLARHGYEKRTGESLAETIGRIDDSLVAAEARAFLAVFQGKYYRDDPFDAETIRNLRLHIENMSKLQ